MSTVILGISVDPTLCENVYYPPFIPHFGKESAFSLITVCLEFLILLFLLSCILRKKWYQCRGLENEARSLLLPFYDRVIYFYCIITLLRIAFYLAQFVHEIFTPINTRDPQYTQPIWIIIGDTVGMIGIIGLQVFILFLLMQTSAGTKAYKRAYRGTLIVCIIELTIIILKQFYGEIKQNYYLFCIGEILEETVLFCIFIGVFIYCYFYQMVKKRKRQRNKILYVYIILLCLLMSVLITAYILLIFKIDGYCLDIIEQYLFRLFFPWIAFITIRSDSEFWRMLLLSWQTSSLIASGENNNENDNILDKIKAIFGTDNHSKRSFIDPLIDALSLGVKMVDFTELQETSDPIAMGSTATVSKAKLAGEVVAIKVFIFDELSIEVVSEFFRESLLISNLSHDNIVEFKGACLRPPELCLVYEYCCCGDLTHLLLTQFFHPGSLNRNKEENEEEREDPKLFKHRIKMLLDVAKGMTRLHDSGIIHRDLKTSNVLVHYTSHGGYIAKVCDFGSARKILSKHGMNIFGDSKPKKAYVPPHNMEYAKSLEVVIPVKRRNVTIKRHEIVMENKDDKQRANTINIANGVYKRSSGKGNGNEKGKGHGKRLRNMFVAKKNKKNNKKQMDDHDRMRVFSKSERVPEEDEKGYKISGNYSDIDEEEKYDKPHYRTDEGGELEESQSLQETEVNYDGRQTVNQNRDPTKLAFNVSPVLLTTQVGTLAFMAPEMLSHVNIGALSGGWQNKEKSNKSKKDEQQIEEERAESERNLCKQGSSPDEIARIVMNDSSRALNNSTKTNWPSTTEGTNSPGLQSQSTNTIVIKIDNKSTEPSPSMKSMEIKSNNMGKMRNFTREYINKHRELTTNRDHIPAPPDMSLPPPPQKRRMSVMSQGIKRMFTSTTQGDAMNSWQNKDIYYYNTPGQSPYIQGLNPYYAPLKPQKVVPATFPPQQQPQQQQQLQQQQQQEQIEIRARNAESYIHRALPPDPPKKKKQKANYFTRGRAQSKFSVRSQNIDDDLRSVIYDTHKFEIVYEVSDTALYNDSVDVYSFAVIMWECSLCDRIYNEMDMKMIRDMVCEGQRMPTPTHKQCKKIKNGLCGTSQSVYNPLIELINECWAQSPADRPKFYEIQKRLTMINNLHHMKP